MLQALLIILIASQISCHPLNTRFVLGATNATIEHIARCALRKNSTNIHLDRARCVLESYPLIDGHNDLAALYGIFANDSVYSVDLNSDMSFVWNHSYSRVDIPKLRMGLLGGQFWSCWVPCDAQYRDAVRMTLEQLDVIKRFINYYPGTFQFVDTSDDVLKSFHAGKIASMIGLEGGHSIDSSLGALRMYYELGVRYMTVTHSCNTPWADNWMVDEPTYNGTVLNGLTPFGKTVILEMNRLGMIVDLAHVAKKTMLDVLNVTRAPVLFTHSSVFSLCNHHRNVQDDVLLKTKANGGVVMVNFYTFFVTCSPNYKTEATLSDVAGMYCSDYHNIAPLK
ncbi:dipeptidase 1-like isoform X1 [Dreissena polymorpha]|uniref:dipeptidase 1-like isoform X1 n=1 Tax=Dreissena polymorpha TaxID=45954 RepID=UPI0022649F95|nr:dipeptidase 1-like isoform X1 [Dreissena polymorpha]XP_052247142.1 dipeptidase 1-like isoform X1 [Dreissena polymorpha]